MKDKGRETTKSPGFAGRASDPRALQLPLYFKSESFNYSILFIKHKNP